MHYTNVAVSTYGETMVLATVVSQKEPGRVVGARARFREADHRHRARHHARVLVVHDGDDQLHGSPSGAVWGLLRSSTSTAPSPRL